MKWIGIEWHKKLHDLETVGNLVKKVTLPSLGALRVLNNDILSDVLFYFTSFHGQKLLNIVCSEINREYKEFAARHPNFKGSVSFYTHSLGSIIVYDLLANQHNAGLCQDPVYPATQTHYEIKYPKLDIIPRYQFSLGSPIAAVLIMRGQSFKDYQLPSTRFFNIFNLFDPIAYRLEPLLMQKYNNISPICWSVTQNSFEYYRQMIYAYLPEINVPNYFDLDGIVNFFGNGTLQEGIERFSSFFFGKSKSKKKRKREDDFDIGANKRREAGDDGHLVLKNVEEDVVAVGDRKIRQAHSKIKHKQLEVAKLASNNGSSGSIPDDSGIIMVGNQTNARKSKKDVLKRSSSRLESKPETTCPISPAKLRSLPKTLDIKTAVSLSQTNTTNPKSPEFMSLATKEARSKLYALYANQDSLQSAESNEDDSETEFKKNVKSFQDNLARDLIEQAKLTDDYFLEEDNNDLNLKAKSEVEQPAKPESQKKLPRFDFYISNNTSNSNKLFEYWKGLSAHFDYWKVYSD